MGEFPRKHLSNVVTVTIPLKKEEAYITQSHTDTETIVRCNFTGVTYPRTMAPSIMFLVCCWLEEYRWWLFTISFHLGLLVTSSRSSTLSAGSSSDTSYPVEKIKVVVKNMDRRILCSCSSCLSCHVC